MAATAGMKDRSLRHCKTGGPAQFTGTPRIVAVYNVKGDPFQKHGVAAFDVVDGSVFVCVNMWVPEDMHVYLAIDRVMKLFFVDVRVVDVEQRGRQLIVPQMSLDDRVARWTTKGCRST